MEGTLQCIDGRPVDAARQILTGTDELPRYKHAPLNKNLGDLRLVLLQPGMFTDDIHIRIWKLPMETPISPLDIPIRDRLTFLKVPDPTPSFLDLPTSPRRRTSRIIRKPAIYEALSYAWGSSTLLSVTQNLEIALRHLRSTTSERVLWIDAICIDQTNDEEKSEQVQRMAKIYNLASQVLVWLGPEADHSSLAVEFLEYIDSRVSFDYQVYRFELLDLAKTEDTWLVDRDKDCPWMMEEHLGTILMSLLDRRWFYRLWVRQEVRFARQCTVMVGHARISWLTFRRGASWSLDRFRVKKEAGLVSLLKPSSHATFWDLMFEAICCQCTDPKDKIYAMLGILSRQYPELEHTIEPDYDPKVSVTDVYLKAFYQFSRLFKNLDCLLFIEHIHDPQWRPTWVPNWNDAVRGQYRAPRSADCYSTLNDIEIEGYTLTVYALRKDFLRALIPFPPDPNAHALHYVRALHRVLSGIPELANEFYGQDSFNSVCEALICRRPSEDFIPPIGNRAKVEDLMRVFYSIAQLTTDTIESDIDILYNTEFGLSVGDVVDCMQLVWEGRVFVLTEDGHMGLAPHSTQKGDIISVILGCRSPIVLRSSHEDGQYEVIGPSIIIGFQDGQALLGPLPDKYRPVIYIDPNGVTMDALFDTESGEILDLAQDPRLPPEERDKERTPEF